MHFFLRQGDFNDVVPNTLTHCNQNIYNIDGRGQVVTPGTVIEYQVEDLFGRPWAAVWEVYFEDGMQRPGNDSLFEFE